MIPKLSKVLSQTRHSFRERDFAICCSECAEERNLARCMTRSSGEVRTYRCPECGHLLVTVGHSSARQIANDDSRAEAWLSIHPDSDLFVQLHGSRLTIPPVQVGRIFGEPLL